VASKTKIWPGFIGYWWLFGKIVGFWFMDIQYLLVISDLANGKLLDFSLD
jgi:hypothetical protein